MNAPAAIAREGPAWERYLPAVDMLSPGQGDEARRHRAGMMLLRDIATDRQREACPEAAKVLAVIEQLAAWHALSTLGAEELGTARLALVRMMTAARDLQRVFGNDAHGGG